MTVEVLFPRQEMMALPELMTAVERMRPCRPCHPETAAYFARVAEALFDEEKQASTKSPEINALAFWLRRGAVDRLQLGESLQGTQPVGKAFHLAPANVETMFAYTLFLSMVGGNPTVVRVSQRSGEQTEKICRALTSAAREGEPPCPLVVVRYGHDDEVSRALVAQSQLVVLWGGDETIRGFQERVPTAARQLVFSTRVSAAVLSASEVCAADDLSELVRRFYNDAYAFDQAACSSPRQVFWQGSSQQCPQASERFFSTLEKHLERVGYRVHDSLAMEKLGQAFVDGSRGAVQCRRYGPELTVARVCDPQARDICEQAGGYFHEAFVDSLDEVTPWIHPKDQTLLYWGYAKEDIERWGHDACLAGVDRLVQIGQGLQFDRYWDGMDLFAQMTRQVVVR